MAGRADTQTDMTLMELIAELQKYPPDTVAKRFNPDDGRRELRHEDDIDVVAVINRDGYVSIV